MVNAGLMDISRPFSFNSFAITAALAAGDNHAFLSNANALLQEDLKALGYADPRRRAKLPELKSTDLPPLFELNRIYNRARAITNGILAGGTLLPSILDASDRVLETESWDEFPDKAEEDEALFQGSRFDDHPSAYKAAQIKLARLMAGPRDEATKNLPDDVREAMLNARKVQMLSWALMRVKISDSISDTEIAEIRANKTTKDAMETILGLAKERISTGFPARVMQHDHYQETLNQLSADVQERPESELLRNSMNSMIENSNTVMQHLIGRMVARMRSGVAAKEAIKQLISHDISDIALVTQKVSHENPFSDRSRPHPDFKHDFALFVMAVDKRSATSAFGENGVMTFQDEKKTRRGGCPAQNTVEFKNAANTKSGSLAGRANETVKALKKYSTDNFGVEAKFLEPVSVAELFIATNLFALLKPNGPLNEGSDLFDQVITPLADMQSGEYGIIANIASQ